MPDQQPAIPQPKLNDKTFELSGEKLIGYVLLVIGVLIIAAATYTILQILTGKSKAPKVFDVEGPSFQLPSDSTTMEASKSSASVKLIPDEVFNGTLNIGLYYLAMMFLASSGAKVAGIGVKMIKDIKVQIKEEKIRP